MEEQLIQILSNSIKDPSFIGDDCAVIKIEDQDYLFSLDNFIENTHFSSEYFSPEDIGWKALAVNISDIAAMAGQPLYVMVGLSLNKSLSNKDKWVKAFYEGMQECADKFGSVKIIGGDITSQEGFTSISVAIVGKTQKAQLRKLDLSSKPNLSVCVTGKFGNSGAYLHSAKEIDKIYHLKPEPRIVEAKYLEAQFIDAALMDASDGLAASLYTLAEQNQVNIEIDSSLIPKDEHISLEEALYGGEDYELVGLFDEDFSANLPENFTKIGVITYEDKPQKVFDVFTKEALDKTKQYQHF